MRHRLIHGAALIAAFLLAGTAFLLVGTAAATTLKRLTLAEVSESAPTILVGTVAATDVVPGRGERKLLFTEVEFERLAVWKSAVATATVTYRFVGGALNDRTLRVDGVPSFEVGQRCVLFVDPEADDLCPTVGWSQGHYQVRTDPDTGAELVHDSDGRPVYGFAAGVPVLVPTQDHPRALTLVDLQVEVLRALEAAAARAAKEPPTDIDGSDAPVEDAETEETDASDEKTDQPPPPARDEDGR